MYLIKKILLKITKIVNFLDSKFINFILKRKKKIYYNSSNFFTIRNLGGASVARVYSFHTKEKETLEWIDKFESGQVFFDVGSNIGLYSIYFGIKNYKNFVVSFEPEGQNFYSLRSNIIDNKLHENIIAFPLALGDKILIDKIMLDEVKVNSFGRSNFLFSSNILDSTDHKYFTQGVFKMTLDYFIEVSNIIPNHIKIDVDGYELEVIQGMTKILNNNNLHSILIEINSSNKKQIFAILAENQFCLYDYKQDKKDNSNNYIFYRKYN
jgi:FkbM family methyltransferase